MICWPKSSSITTAMSRWPTKVWVYCWIGSWMMSYSLIMYFFSFIYLDCKIGEDLISHVLLFPETQETIRRPLKNPGPKTSRNHQFYHFSNRKGQQRTQLINQEPRHPRQDPNPKPTQPHS